MAKRHIDIEKTALYAIVINALQIAAALIVALLALIVGDRAFTGRVEQLALTGMALVVIWGAVLDIRDAFAARRLNRQSDMLEEALERVNELNTTLRAQRHDFMNHLQVVFGLIDMGETGDAREYIERVYGDIQRVGQALKTAIPAVNALLAAKLSECRARGIDARLETASAWGEVPAADWEICRVLGNLVDNALDALRGESAPHLTIRIGETLREYTFSVENDGPAIDPAFIGTLFEPGVTTHGEGRGMGLSIVKDIMDSYGGRVEVESDEARTRFSGFLPKAQTVLKCGSRGTIVPRLPFFARGPARPLLGPRQLLALLADHVAGALQLFFHVDHQVLAVGAGLQAAVVGLGAGFVDDLPGLVLRGDGHLMLVDHRAGANLGVLDDLVGAALRLLLHFLGAVARVLQRGVGAHVRGLELAGRGALGGGQDAVAVAHHLLRVLDRQRQVAADVLDDLQAHRGVHQPLSGQRHAAPGFDGLLQVVQQVHQIRMIVVALIGRRGLLQRFGVFGRLRTRFALLFKELVLIAIHKIHPLYESFLSFFALKADMTSSSISSGTSPRGVRPKSIISRAMEADT